MLSQNMDDQEALGALMHRLGSHKATYKRQFFAPSKLLAISFIVGLFLDAILMIILMSLVIPTLVIAGLLLLECILIFYQNRKLCVFVYENGLIHRGRDSRLTIIYWKNVRCVSHTLEKTMWSDPLTQEPSYRSVYTVSCTNGTVLQLDETFAKLRQLGESLKRETAHYLFSTALNTYEMGQPVVFGSLTVTQEGLSYEAALLPWNEITGIKILSGMVEIKRQGQRSIWANVPNSEVLKMLVHHIRGASLSGA